MADFEARWIKAAPSSASPFLRHDSRRLCGWGILGAVWGYIQNTDVQFLKVVVANLSSMATIIHAHHIGEFPIRDGNFQD